MYIPKAFEFKNAADQIAFMRRYSFATIITCIDNIPVATQLPFIIDDSSGKLLLRAHFAMANEQAQHIEDNTSLVIFSEPHAYISPSHYDKRESVPTWDYIAVHAYGKARLLEDEASKLQVLEQMITFYERGYMEQWNSLPDKFKTGMMRGIAAFELEVSDLQGQKKLSQNKTEAERERIIRHLEENGDNTAKDLAIYIKNTSHEI
jgi:transcriptional regulator